MAFDILQNSFHPGLPWTCRLPFKRDKNARSNEINHPNKIKFLSSASFEYSGSGDENFIDQFKNEKTIRFIESEKNWLTLKFDKNKQGKNKVFEQLGLTVEY
jgi:hypothetical protein